MAAEVETLLHGRVSCGHVVTKYDHSFGIDLQARRHVPACVCASADTDELPP